GARDGLPTERGFKDEASACGSSAAAEGWANRRRAEALVLSAQSPVARLEIPPPTRDRPLHRRFCLSGCRRDRGARRRTAWRAGGIRRSTNAQAGIHGIPRAAFLGQ